MSSLAFESLRDTAPDSVHEAIQANYACASASRPSHYLCEGELTSDYRFADSIHADGSRNWVSAIKIIDGMIERRSQEALGDEGSGRPLTVLDVGTGYGQFLNVLQADYGAAVEVAGITAYDYRQGKQSPGQTYVVGNAEYPTEHFEAASQDVIISELTLCHMADGLGTLSELYTLLKPGGVLIAGGFELRGLKGMEDAVLNNIAHSGVPLFATYHYTLNEHGLRVGRKSLDHDVPIGFDLRTMLALRRPSLDLRLMPPVEYGPNAADGFFASYQASQPVATVPLPAQDALAPLCRDLHSISPVLLARLDDELFAYPLALVNPDMEQTFLQQWYPRLGLQPSHPTWRAFEHGVHALFETVLSGPAVHREISETLQVPQPTASQKGCARPRWFPYE